MLAAAGSGGVYIFEDTGGGWGEVQKIPVVADRLALDDGVLAVASGADLSIYERMGGTFISAFASTLSATPSQVVAAADVVVAGTRVFDRKPAGWQQADPLTPVHDGPAAARPGAVLVSDWSYQEARGRVAAYERIEDDWVLTRYVRPAEPVRLSFFGRSLAFVGDQVVVLDEQTLTTDPGAHIFAWENVEGGEPCVSASDCSTGFCVDGVCCLDACGGGVTDDCMACSLEAGGSLRGTCTPVPEFTPCGAPPSGPCDAADSCGGGFECVDHAAGAATLCRGSEGPCDPPETCFGSRDECPPRRPCSRRNPLRRRRGVRRDPRHVRRHPGGLSGRRAGARRGYVRRRGKMCLRRGPLLVRWWRV